MRKFAIPHTIYEALPAVYAAAGVISIFQLPNTLGWLSGLLLIGAGWYVWRMRFAYRQHPKHRRSADRANHMTRTHGSNRHGRSPGF